MREAHAATTIGGSIRQGPDDIMSPPGSQKNLGFVQSQPTIVEGVGTRPRRDSRAAGHRRKHSQSFSTAVRPKYVAETREKLKLPRPKSVEIPSFNTVLDQGGSAKAGSGSRSSRRPRRRSQISMFKIHLPGGKSSNSFCSQQAANDRCGVTAVLVLITVLPLYLGLLKSILFDDTAILGDVLERIASTREDIDSNNVVATSLDGKKLDTTITLGELNLSEINYLHVNEMSRTNETLESCPVLPKKKDKKKDRCPYQLCRMELNFQLTTNQIGVWTNLCKAQIQRSA